MKPSNIYDILDMTVKAREQNRNFNPCFVSAAGLGKSEVVQQWTKDRAYGLVDIRTALQEAPDLKGFPVTQEIDGKMRMAQATPSFWPTEGKGVILFDEINRGNTSVMNALMQILTDRKLAEYTLPEGWIIVSCINPETLHYDVNTMDTALRDRLEFFTIEYDKRSFLDFAKKTDWDPTVIHFIDSNTWMYRSPEEIGNTPGAKYLSPRSFSKLNAAIKAGVPEFLELNVYCSLLGDLTGKSFYQFKTNDQPITFKELTENEKASIQKLKQFCDPSNYKTGHVSILQRSLIENEKLVTDEMLYKVSMAIGPEQAISLIKEIEYRRGEEDVLQRLGNEYKDFTKYIRSLKKVEVEILDSQSSSDARC